MGGLFIHDVPAACINAAAVHYYVPAKVIIAVLETEGGRAGLAKMNHNGTADYGPMQINSVWLKKIAPYGYTVKDIQYDACKNVMVGSWILSTQIAQSGSSYWQGVGNYHSHTAINNSRYQQTVYRHYAALQKALGYAA